MTAPGCRLGFVDYCLDNFHADIYLKMLRGPLADRGFSIAGATAEIVEPSREWAKSNEIQYYDDLTDLNSQVDKFIVLAPSNPEVHLGICERVFAFGKPTFVDKTFAPDIETARQIFDLADQHGIPVQTTSALRTTNVQQEIRSREISLKQLVVWAGGSSWDEYGIHPVELVISCLGPEVRGVMRTGPVDFPTLVLEYTDGRTAVIVFNPANHVPFQAALTTTEGTETITVDDSRLFQDAAAAILDFFEAGKPLIDRAETLAVRRVLDVALSEQANNRMFALEP